MKKDNYRAWIAWMRKKNHRKEGHICCGEKYCRSTINTRQCEPVQEGWEWDSTNDVYTCPKHAID